MDFSTSLVSSQALVNVVLCAVFDTFPARIRVLHQLIPSGIRASVVQCNIWLHMCLAEKQTQALLFSVTCFAWEFASFTVRIFTFLSEQETGETVDL